MCLQLYKRVPAIDSVVLIWVYSVINRADFYRGEDKGSKHTWNMLVPHKAEIEELPVVSIAKTWAAHITDKTTPSRKPVVRKEGRL